MNIKKKMLGLGSALMLLATTLNAQSQPWSFGAKAGVSLFWLTGLDSLKPAAGTSATTNNAHSDIFATGGLTMGYAFHKNIGVGLEVLYARVGGKLESLTALPNNATDQDKANHKPYKMQILSHNLAIPVMLKLFPMGCDPDDGIWVIDLGAQFSFPISASVKDTQQKNGVLSDGLEVFKDKDGKEFDKSSQLNPVTVDIIAGSSYEFPEIGLTIEWRYHLGLGDILKNDSDAKNYRKDKMMLAADKNISSHGATFSVGYNFARLLMD